MKIHPPTYPLSRDAFKLALTTGHGRALIHAEKFGVAEYRDEILEAATTCLVYDTQFDGYRECWLAQLCQFAGLFDTIIGQSPSGSAKDRAQRAALLKEVYLAGHSAALPQLYALCSFDNPTGKIFGCDELIQVDGEKGLIFVAKRLGEALLQDPDYSKSNWQLTCFDELNGAGRARAVLSEVAPSDPAIQHYLQVMTSDEEEGHRGNEPYAAPPVESVENILQTILTATKRERRLRAWGRKATVADRIQVMELLKMGSPPMVLVNALWCLSRTGLPEFDEAKLWLVFHEDEDVRFLAAQVFAHHREPQVRLAGLALLKRGDLLIGTRLLELSATEDDSEAILSALADKLPTDAPHGVFSNLIELLEAHETIREPLIPLFIYEFSPCMLCRERAIETLVKWGKCPQWVAEEAIKDASADIRELVESHCTAV